MAINERRISLTHEKLHFLGYSVLGVIYSLIDVLGHFSVILHSATMKFLAHLKIIFEQESTFSQKQMVGYQPLVPTICGLSWHEKLKIST